MGAKTWMLVYSNGDAAESLKQSPKLDRDKTVQFVKELFPNEKLQPIEDGDLSYTSPPDDVIFALSLIHISSPRALPTPRMPASA